MRAVALVMVLGIVGRAEAGDAPLAELTKKLADAAPKDRPQAVRQIGYIRDPARLDVLEKLVADPDPAVRLAALQGLSPQSLDIGKQPRWKALRRKLLADPDPKVRHEAGSQLRPPDPDDVAPILAQLKVETDPLPTDIFVLELHDVNAAGLVDLLIPMVKDPKRQRIAISTLGYTRNEPRVVPVLLEALKHKAPGAVGALGNTGDPKALEAVLEVLRTSSDPDYVEEAVQVQLGNPDPRAVPRLLELWGKLSRADRALALSDLADPMSSGGLPIELSRALISIAEVDPAPCDAQKAATGELRTYLRKLLPKGCQVEIRAALAKAIDDEIRSKDRLHTVDARFAVTGDRDEPAAPTEQVADALTAAHGFTVGKVVHAGSVVGRRGEAAVIAVVAKVKTAGKDAEVRLSALAVPADKGGWAIAGGLWSIGRANAAVNDAGAAGKLALKALPAGRADPAVAEAVKAIVEGQVDTATAQRADFVAIGSAPGEVVKSGAAFFTAWRTGWTDKTTIEGPIVTMVAPSGGTAVAIANLALAKTKGAASYKLPFRVLFGFDRIGERWSLVHVHFAAPAPP